MAEQALYGHVADGSLTDGPRTLPSSWRTDDAEILAFDRLDDPTPYGWWPWAEEDAPAFDPAKQRLEPAVRLDAKAKRIVRGYSVVDLRSNEFPEAQILAVTPAQAKVALFNRGLLDQVKAIIDAQDYEPIKIFYSDATVWEKSNPYLQAIAMQLGLVVYDDAGNEDATELDKVFYEASKL